MTIDSPQRQLQDACTALDRALRSGHDARVETWLEACPALASDDDLAIELIYSEYVTREALGPVPQADEYYHRFPNWAGRLQRLFEVDDLLKPAGTVADEDTATDTHKPLANTSPKRIGQFELHERLGSGGMGVVYRARQGKPARDVAIKLLRAGAEAGATERARFRREAEAIARLQHPNIIAVYEVGEVDAQPYLAMEFVRGGDLHSFLNGRPQPSEWTAQLITTLAKAVQFAHDNGIVHRDIKPGNILLTGDEPKLTDFGLAALNDSSEGLTRTGQVLGTLAYLAPEQAAATLDATLPSVDIYALGAVLYECLTGRPPFVADAETTTLEMILHADPVPPRKLNPGVPRDLETIALKCLSKSPLKRYRTSQALAEDLARYQVNEPILARPTGPLERAVRWSRRRPAIAATLAAAAVSIVVIGGLIAGYTSRLRSTLNDVDAQRLRAETQELATQQALTSEKLRREQAFAALEKLTEQLTEGSLGEARNVQQQAKELEETLATYEKLAAESGSGADQRRAAAGALRQMARIRVTLKRRSDALANYENAIAMLRGLVAEAPDNQEYRAFLSLALYESSSLNLDLRIDEAALRDGLATTEVAEPLPDRGMESARLRHAHACNMVVVAARRLGRTVEAEAAFREAEALWAGLCRQFPDNEYYRAGWAYGHQMLAMELMKREQWTEAEASYRRATEIRFADGAVPTQQVSRRNQAECFQALAKLSEKRGDAGMALQDHKRALELWDSLAAERRNDTIFTRGFTSTLTIVMKATDRPEDLEPYYARARRYLAAASVDANGNVVIALAATACEHADFHYRKNGHAVAYKSYSAAIAGLAELLAREPKAPQAQSWLTHAQVGAARTLTALGKHDEAVEMWNAALQNVEKPDAVRLIERAKALANAGRIDDALRAAGVVELTDDPLLFLRVAAVHSLAAAATKDAARRGHENRAMEWLAKAHARGVLKQPAYLSYVRGNKDWRALRDREDFKQILEENK